ncbi:MAG: DUF3368 domain-containing protein [Ignavibacteria bacterium]
MPKKDSLVINTSPIISIISATGSLLILKDMYSEIFVPFEVYSEIIASRKKYFAKKEFFEAKFLNVIKQHVEVNSHLKNSLDVGEASVIQTAINNKIPVVCLDETIGRRIARLYDLNLTGSLGILLKYKKEYGDLSISMCIRNMKRNGIYLSDKLISLVLEIAGE